MKRKVTVLALSALASAATMAATALPALTAPGGSSPNGVEVFNKECVESSEAQDCRRLTITSSGHARGIVLAPGDSGGANQFQECGPSREEGEEVCFHQVTTPSGNDNSYLHFKPAR